MLFQSSHVGWSLFSRISLGDISPVDGQQLDLKG
jgi:hypothetical protein